MSLRSYSSIALDLEDFRRLGVRPYESRLTVIRQAAARSSKALAQQQLNAPSEQAALQLSRVTTSAYRLLDPRQRLDASQRAHVGRILPNVLTWAGQTSFHNQASRANRASSSDPMAGVPFSGAELSDAELIEMIDLDSTPMPGGQPAWTNSLTDNDLLDTSPMTRRVSRYKSRLRHPWTWLAIAGLAVGTLLGIATLRSKSDVGRVPMRAALPIDAAPIAAPADEPASTLADVSVSIDATDSVDATEQPLRTFDSSLRDSVEVMETPAAESVPEPVRGLDAQLDLTPVPPVAVSNVGGPLTVGDLSRTPAEASEKDLAMLTESLSEFLPDPFAESLELDAFPMESGFSIPVMESDVVEPEVEPGVKPFTLRVPVPSESSVSTARTQIALMLTNVSFEDSPKRIEDRIAEIARIEVDLQPGSAEFWTARLMIGQLAWLIEDATSVRGRLDRVAEHYDTLPEQLVVESFVQACDLATLPVTQQHLVAVGFVFADDLLIGEHLESAKRVIDAMRPIADSLEDDAARGYIDQYSHALDQMEHLYETSRRMIDDKGKVRDDVGSTGILGRYFCLMLRRWDEGLPWLTKASDPRVASAARRELELGENASVDDSVMLSKLWFTLAERSSGHAADSMRLHAISILQSVKSEATSVQILDIESEVDKAQQQLPEFLQAR